VPHFSGHRISGFCFIYLPIFGYISHGSMHTKLSRKCPLLALWICRRGALVRDEFPTLIPATNENFTTTKTPFSGKETMLAFSFALRGLVFCTTSCKPNLKLEERVYDVWRGKYATGERGKH